MESIVYNQNIDAELREQMFYTFMYMDNRTFGNELFTNIPEGMMDDLKYDKENGRVWIKDVAEPKQAYGETSKMLYIESCGSSWSCKNHESWSNCDHCAACYTSSCSTTVIWIPDESFPGSPGMPGGGGGGGPSIPPKDPCGLTTVFYRLAPGCGGGSPEVLEDPCEKIKKSTNDSKYKSNITDLEGKTGLDHEEGYRLGTPISGSGQTGTQNQLLQNLPGTHEVDMKIFSNTFALIHTHYDGIYPIFSPGDILLFNNWIVWANTWNSVPTNTPKIPLNNLTLTVVTSNGNYVLAFDGSVVDPLPAYTQEQFDNLNKDYKEDYLDKTHTNGNFNMEKIEKEFLSFISEKMNMAGLKLYRVKSDGNYEISLSDLDGTKCP